LLPGALMFRRRGVARTSRGRPSPAARIRRPRSRRRPVELTTTPCWR